MDEERHDEVVSAQAAALRVQHLREAFRQVRSASTAQAAHGTVFASALGRSSRSEGRASRSGGGAGGKGQVGGNGGVDSSDALTGPAPVEALRRQWQEQQRRQRMLSRVEQQQQHADRLLLLQWQHTVPRGGRHEHPPGSSREEYLQRVVLSTGGGPTAGEAAAAATVTPFSATPLLYGYSDRGPNAAGDAAYPSPSRSATRVAAVASTAASERTVTASPLAKGYYRRAAAPNSNRRGAAVNIDGAFGDTATLDGGPAGAASTTAAVVAAAAANLSTILATASMAFGRRPDAVSPSRRNLTPPLSKPMYAPDSGPAFDSRLPVFLNTTNARHSQRRPRLQSTAAQHAASKPGAPNAAAAAACASVSGVVRGASTAAERSSDHDGGGSAGGVSAADYAGASRPAFATSRTNRSGSIGCGAASNAGAKGGAWPGRLVYDSLGQVDMHYPEVGSIRPRGAAAVMGRGKRGLDETPRQLDDRGPLEVSDALLRKRVPSASFAAPSYGGRTASPRTALGRQDDRGRGGGGADGGGAEESAGGRRPRRAWDPPCEQQMRRTRGPITDVDTVVGPDSSARWSQGASGVVSAAAAAAQPGPHLAARTDTTSRVTRRSVPRVSLEPSLGTAERDVGHADRSRSRSRSRGAARRRWASGGGEPDGRGGLEAQVTAEALRSAPSAAFSRAARFPEQPGEGATTEALRFGRTGDTGPPEGGGKAGEGQRSRGRRQMWGNVAPAGGGSDGAPAEVGQETGGGGSKATAKAAAATAMAPLQLDVSYHAVLPRVTSAVISASSRRFDWLPRERGAATTSATRQRQHNGTRGRSSSPAETRGSGWARRRPWDVRRTYGGEVLTRADGEEGGNSTAVSEAGAGGVRSRSAPSEVRQGRARRQGLRGEAVGVASGGEGLPVPRRRRQQWQQRSSLNGLRTAANSGGDSDRAVTDYESKGGLESDADGLKADGQAAARGGRPRRGRQQPPLEPMAPLDNLAAAVAAVRPRVQAPGFAHRSVAEGMRRELQERRQRQLRKAQQLQEQLRNQTVDQLWPAAAAAAQLRRRERLSALSRRRRGSDGSGAPGSMPSSQPSPLTQQQQQRQQPGGPSEPQVAVLTPQAEVAVETAASPGPPRAPRQAPLAVGLVGPSTGPQSTGVGEQPRAPAAASAAAAAVPTAATGPPAPPPVRSGAVSAEPPPHFLAATRRTLGNLTAALPPAAAATGGAAPVALVPSLVSGGGRARESLPSEPQAAGSVADPWVASPSLLDPSYSLVEKRAPAVSFSPARQPPQPRPRYNREPGPGHYDPELADSAISRLARTPAAVFGTARRSAADPYDSPTRPSAAAAAAAAEVAWLSRDPAAALDFTRRRVPAVLILPETTAPLRPQAGDTAGDVDGDGATAPLLLDLRFTLVEPRVRGTPVMRKPPAPVVHLSDEDGQPLERLAGPSDPWAIDLATRPRRPAWGFSALGHADMTQSPVGRHLLDLRPVYDLVHRRVAGVLEFSRAPERNAGEEERLRELRRQPGIGEYDVEMAWSYLCRRAPQVLMALAAPRWRDQEGQDGARGDGDTCGDGEPGGDGDGDAGVRQRRQALLELSQALDYIRPRPPAWTFAPIVRMMRRNGESADPRARGVGFGPLLSWDVNTALVRRRLPGALPFGVGPRRRGLLLPLLDSRALAAVRHLAPGYYEAELAWRAAQPLPRAADFSRGTGHVLDADEPPPPDDGGDLPYGARLVLNAAAAKDVTLPRRDRGAPRPMGLALGRDQAMPADPAYDVLTAHLPLPDPDLDLPIRPRVRHVVLAAGAPGHQPLAPEPSTQGALRGPGAYFPEGAEQALATVGPSARAVDFGRGPERDLLGGDRTATGQALEGNRLVLSPHTATDFVRPRAPAALIQPRHTDGEPYDDLPYHHAMYDVEPGLGLLLRRPPGQPNFGARPGRDPPLAWPAGIDPAAASYGRAVGWLGPEDVALTQLAGFRRAPGAPDFARTRPRTPPGKVGFEGQRLLDLDPDAARDRLRHQPPRPPNLALGRGHEDPTGVAGGHDRELTAWLAYRPRWDAVRRHLVPPLAVPLARQIGREQAGRADPRVGDNATGDLDGGAYRVRYRMVRRSAPAIDFGRGAGLGPSGRGLAPGALPSDPAAGNVLLLDPRLPTGWRPPRHSEGSPTRQPFGRGEARWERPGADPAYRFLAAVGDEGPALYLRHSADDLALLRGRATTANAPAAAWGWMTSRRDAQVLQPDPARSPRPRLPSPAVSRVATQLVMQLPPPGSELEVIKDSAPHDPRVVAIRRRDRVLQRMLDKIKAQRAALADV